MTSNEQSEAVRGRLELRFMINCVVSWSVAELCEQGLKGEDTHTRESWTIPNFPNLSPKLYSVLTLRVAEQKSMLSITENTALSRKLGVETIRARLCDLLMKPEDDDVPSL